MKGVEGHASALQDLLGQGQLAWANKMNFVMNHAPGTGSIAL